MVGGLLVSQVITLDLTPVFYTYLESFRDKLANGKMANGAEVVG
jgi:HAE1 family hydrophobic/amphiphilic exporter-1